MRRTKYRIIILLTLIMLVDVVGHSADYVISKQEEKKEYKEKYSEVMPLVYYVGGILGSYSFVPEDSSLAIYDQLSYCRYYSDSLNFQKFNEEKPTSMHVQLDVIHIDHDGKRGYVWVDGGSTFEPGGSSGGILDLWFIEKDGWRWNVVDIDGGIDGRRWLWR